MEVKLIFDVEKTMKNIWNICIILTILFWAYPLLCQERTIEEYKIGPKDLLVVNVVGEDDYPLELRVTE